MLQILYEIIQLCTIQYNGQLYHIGIPCGNIEHKIMDITIV